MGKIAFRVVIFFTISLLGGTADSRAWAFKIQPDHLGAASAVLLDQRTGQILFDHNAGVERPFASITKIMTAVLILERGRLDKMVLVSKKAASVGGAGLGLKPGQRVSLKDLLAAILVVSANDAAVAAAEHVAKSEENFVALMNAKAAALGMKDTRFANPHGLDEDDHYSTAYDLAILTRYALKNQAFTRLVKSQAVRVAIANVGKKTTVRRKMLKSHNRLLGRFLGANGVKTGYTADAGPCLVASASRGNRRLIAVLLNDPDRWANAATLLEYGFATLAAKAENKTISLKRLGVHQQGG